jgi:16S rRNA (guanine527-N7)-methyltransferase
MARFTDVQIREGVEAEAQRLGCAVTTTERNRLAEYCRLLQRWNRAVRLVGRADLRSLVEVHLADSLALCAELRRQTNEPLAGDTRLRLLDVGTGAGLPGIVIAIVCPALCVTLCEVSSKRVSFLRTVIHSLRLDCQILECDIGTLPAADRRFDHVVSRAVFPPERWTTIASRVCAPRGVIWSMLTERQRAELTRASPAAPIEFFYQLADGRQRCLRREEPFLL